jgi:hypothetical protein
MRSYDKLAGHPSLPHDQQPSVLSSVIIGIILVVFPSFSSFSADLVGVFVSYSVQLHSAGIFRIVLLTSILSNVE